ncbi:proteolipid protein 2b [Latimeria chalumnae]|uniref:proteolipid protein 2b n=1 Tax=Latimeria chalumnae TaxID=7897 RepID=UPI00313C693E
MSDSASPAGGPGCFQRFLLYLRTRKGVILATEIVLCLIILICYVASRYGGYSAVAICEMVFAIIFFVVFAWEFDKTFRIIHWPWSDMIRAVIGALLFLITSLISVIQGGDGARIAGGVLGIIAGILFGYDAYTILPTLRKTQHTAAPTDPSDGV